MYIYFDEVHTYNKKAKGKVVSMRISGRILRALALWIIAICLSVGVFALVVSIASYFILLYPPVQERIIRAAEVTMDKYLVGDFKIERFESNLLSYVDIYGFHGMGKSEYRDSVYAGHISIRYKPLSLLRKRLEVTSVNIKDVRGHVVMLPGSDIRLPVMPMMKVDSLFRFVSSPSEYEDGRRTLSSDIKRAAELPLRFDIGPTRIEGLSAVYRDLDNEMVGEIKNASVNVRWYSLDSFYAELRVPDASYESPWWSGAVDTIGAASVITWTGLEVKSMMLRGSGTYVTGEGRLSYFEDGPWDLKATFSTNVKPLPVLHEYIEGLGRESVFSGTASYGGKLYEPLWKADVYGRGVKYYGYNIGAMTIDASYRYDDEYGRARVRGNSEFGEFDVDASILMQHLMDGPEFGGYSADALLTGLRVKRVFDELGVDLPMKITDGNARLRVRGEGIEMPSEMSVSAELGGADIEGGLINIGADITGDAFDLAGSWGVNRFGGSGTVGLLDGVVRGSVFAELQDPSFVAKTLLDEHMIGKITASADIDGAFDKLDVSAFVRVDTIEWRGMRADFGEAYFTVTDGKTQLTKADAKVAGRIDSIADYFGQDSIAGHVEAEFAIVVSLENPVLHAQIDGRELRYGQYGIDDISGVFAFVNDTLRWRDLRLREKVAIVYSNGRLRLGDGGYGLKTNADVYIEPEGAPRRRAGRLSFEGSMYGDSLRAKCRVTSATLDLLDYWLPEKHRLKGALALNGEFSGTLANPRARVDFQVTNPEYYGNKAYTFVGDVVLVDSSVNVGARIRLSHQSGAIEFMSVLPFLPSDGWKLDETGTRSAFVKAQAKDFNIRSATGFLEPDFLVYGLASFNAQATNNGGAWALDGKLTLPGGQMRYVPERIDAHNVRLSVAVAGTLDDPVVAYTLLTDEVEMPDLRMEKSYVAGRNLRDTLIVDTSRFSFKENSHVSVKGKMLLSGMDSLLYDRNMYAQYSIRNIPVSLFSFILPDYQISKGVFNGSGVIYADGGRPMADGMLYLSRFEMTLPDISPTLGPINASIKFDGNKAELVSSDAKWGRGMIRADGRLTWDMDKISNINMKVKVADVAFELPEVVNVGIESADLQITDRNENINVRGKMTLGPTSYVRDFNILTLLDQLQTGGGVQREPNPFLQSVRLRVDLDLANNAGININLGTAFVDGRIVVVGSLDEPGIVGEVNITDGFVYYLDRKFKITEGTLFNSDQTTINPTLNIIASTDVVTYSPTARNEAYTITLSLQGTLENPIVRLMAQPTLSELDILSVLTFGERMGGLGSDINDRLMNIAAQQALGLGARRIERLLNIDRISVGGDIMGTGGGQGSGATIGMTKSISSRLNLTYETNMGDLGDQKVTARYRLLPNLYLEGQTANNGENALDLIFRYSR